MKHTSYNLLVIFIIILFLKASYCIKNNKFANKLLKATVSLADIKHQQNAQIPKNMDGD